MKNLEIKKMSLAKIEDRLTPDEMEKIIAGGACIEASVGLAVAFAGAFFVATTGGAALFAVGFIYSSYGMHACQ